MDQWKTWFIATELSFEIYWFILHCHEYISMKWPFYCLAQNKWEFTQKLRHVNPNYLYLMWDFFYNLMSYNTISNLFSLIYFSYRMFLLLVFFSLLFSYLFFFFFDFFFFLFVPLLSMIVVCYYMHVCPSVLSVRKLVRTIF